MNETETIIEQLDAEQTRAVLPGLIALLQDSVDNGASVGFWPPLDSATAQHYWEDIIEDLPKGYRVLLVARRGDKIVGSVQLDMARKANAVHRAEVQKLMVHTSERGKGLGKTLLLAIEKAAQEAGRRLLLLDTRTGDPAEQLYLKYGYEIVGIFTDYVIEVDGTYSGSTFFYKKL